MNATWALVSSAASRRRQRGCSSATRAEYIKIALATAINATDDDAYPQQDVGHEQLREPPQGPGHYPRSSGGTRTEKSSRLRGDRETSEDRAHVADGAARQMETEQWGEE